MSSVTGLLVVGFACLGIGVALGMAWQLARFERAADSMGDEVFRWRARALHAERWAAGLLARVEAAEAWERVPVVVPAWAARRPHADQLRTLAAETGHDAPTDSWWADMRGRIDDARKWSGAL